MDNPSRNAEGLIRESPRESPAAHSPGNSQIPGREPLDSLPGTGAILAYVWMFSVVLGFFVLRIIGSQTFQALLFRWKNR
jgi:hypothetical protein